MQKWSNICTLIEIKISPCSDCKNEKNEKKSTQGNYLKFLGEVGFKMLERRAISSPLGSEDMMLAGELECCLQLLWREGWKINFPLSHIDTILAGELEDCLHLLARGVIHLTTLTWHHMTLYVRGSGALPASSSERLGCSSSLSTAGIFCTLELEVCLQLWWWWDGGYLPAQYLRYLCRSIGALHVSSWWEKYISSLLYLQIFFWQCN